MQIIAELISYHSCSRTLTQFSFVMQEAKFLREKQEKEKAREEAAKEKARYDGCKSLPHTQLE